MAQQQSSTLPDYLIPLLQPTPSGVTKLIAAWDGLTTESQIRILAELGTGIEKWQSPVYLIKKVLTKALESVNPYIRYLAARKFYPVGKEYPFMTRT